MLPGKLYSSCALLLIFHFLFYRHQKILSKPDDHVGNLDIFFCVVRVLFTALGTCLSYSASFPVVSISLTFEAHQWCWDILFNSLETIPNSYFLENMGLVKCHLVSIRPPTFLMIFLMFITHCFPRAAVTKANSQLLITPLEAFSLSWGYALHLIVWKLFILGIFQPAFGSPPRQVSFLSVFS